MCTVSPLSVQAVRLNLNIHFGSTSVRERTNLATAGVCEPVNLYSGVHRLLLSINSQWAAVPPILYSMFDVALHPQKQRGLLGMVEGGGGREVLGMRATQLLSSDLLPVYV